MVRSPDGDTPFFNITIGVLQGDTIASFLFIICLDYVLRKSIDCNTELGLQITERKSTRYPAVNITDADYADDISIITNNLREENVLLHSIEKSAKEIKLHINVDKTEYMTFNQHNTLRDVMSSHNSKRIKQDNDFKYLGSYNRIYRTRYKYQNWKILVCIKQVN